MNKKILVATAAVLAIGLVSGGLILRKTYHDFEKETFRVAIKTANLAYDSSQTLEQNKFVTEDAVLGFNSVRNSLMETNLRAFNISDYLKDLAEFEEYDKQALESFQGAGYVPEPWEVEAMEKEIEEAEVTTGEATASSTEGELPTIEKEDNTKGIFESEGEYLIYINDLEKIADDLYIFNFDGQEYSIKEKLPITYKQMVGNPSYDFKGSYKKIEEAPKYSVWEFVSADKSHLVKVKVRHSFMKVTGVVCSDIMDVTTAGDN